MTETIAEKLARLDAFASRGKWGQFHPKYMEEAKGESFHNWDSSHNLSAVHEGKRMRLADWKHASDAEFAETLVNSYRSGQLVPLDAPANDEPARIFADTMGGWSDRYNENRRDPCVEYIAVSALRAVIAETATQARVDALKEAASVVKAMSNTVSWNDDKLGPGSVNVWVKPERAVAAILSLIPTEGGDDD